MIPAFGFELPPGTRYADLDAATAGPDALPDADSERVGDCARCWAEAGVHVAALPDSLLCSECDDSPAVTS